jgi:hypothetical protein
MLSSDIQIGATTQGTTFPDIIINCVNGVAEGAIQGFAQLVHDPAALRDSVTGLAKAQHPRRFADGVLLRRFQTDQLDRVWNFGLNLSLTPTCPLPWTMVEATVKSMQGPNSWEFNIMRTLDFIGRNYLRIQLPEINTTLLNTSSDGQITADNTYLGAWHRDLIPRLVQQVSFYPRTNGHKLFEYTGYDIYVHNILFGNCKKEMNDLLSGEDRFELCYDPYRIDGSAMGVASFRAVDEISKYGVSGSPVFPPNPPSTTGPIAMTSIGGSNRQDGFADSYQLSLGMTTQDFRTMYRNNVWYEAPIARNYFCKHSCHSRRMYHVSQIISIPLDILPFGYSIASALPSASISGECGFIKVSVYSNWLDRAFYLTKVKDIPDLHPLVNHTHFVVNDIATSGDKVATGDIYLGWVNDRSLGRFGDTTFTAGAIDATDRDDVKYAVPNSILGKVGNENLEGVIPSIIGQKGVNPRTDLTGFNAARVGVQKYTAAGTGTQAARMFPITSNDYNRVPANLYAVDPNNSSDISEIQSDFTVPLSTVDAQYAAILSGRISVKLLQTGFQTLPCVREFLVKLPNIYITTEWQDTVKQPDNSSFQINNDLYIQAVIVWIIPEDSLGTESMRLYPCHLINREMPPIPGIKIQNEQGQGTAIYTWDQLNLVHPAQIDKNALIENMGIITFTPELAANQFPYAYYDTNISGYIQGTFLTGDGEYQQPFNFRRGKIHFVVVGINGVANVNLNMYRLIF